MTIDMTPRVHIGEVETALRHAIRLPELFSLARERLRPEMLDRPGEEILRLTWEASLEVASRRNGVMPADAYLAWAQVGVEVQAMLSRFPLDSVVNAEEILLGDNGFLFYVFNDSPTTRLDATWGRQLLIRFLEERDVHDTMLRVLISSEGSDRISNLPAFLLDLQQKHQRIDALNGSPVRSAAPADYVPPSLDIGATGLSFLDTALGGGDAPGEVYGILGAFGSGKTLLAVQAAYAKALQYQTLHFDHGRPLRHVYLFHYEAGYDEILRRVWCCAGRIRAERLHDFDINRLSRQGSPLEPYEREMMAAEIARAGEDNVDHEYERLQAAQREVGLNLWLCDFSGPEDNPQRGTGYVAEIASVLAQERRAGREIGSVYIDYVGLACRRHIASMSRPRSDEMRHRVGEFGEVAGRMLARPFGARVYLFHQLSSVANARSFAARQHYSDAAEGKNFAENVHFCFTLGTRDREFNCVQLDCSKHRRSAGLPHPPLLYLRGEMGRFEPATDLTINPVLGRPVRLGEATAVHGGNYPAGANPSSGNPSSGNPTTQETGSAFDPTDNTTAEDFTQIEE